MILLTQNLCFVFHFSYLKVSFPTVAQTGWLVDPSDRYFQKKLLPLSQNKSNFSPEGNSVVAASHALLWCLCACICLPSAISAGQTPQWKGLKSVCLCLPPVRLPANSSSHQTVFYLHCLCSTQPYFKTSTKARAKNTEPWVTTLAICVPSLIFWKWCKNSMRKGLGF